MKKRNHLLRNYQTMGRKIFCAKFAQRLLTNFAAGDEDNNLLLYNTMSEKPMSVLNSNTSNVSSITALTFTQGDDQVVVGSNRGSINVWDLNTLKIGYCLKGHTVEICSFHADKKNQQVIGSGSFDTNAKLWDLRMKNCLYTLKNHNKRVSAINIAMDSRLFITGGEDGAVFSFDVRMFKPVFQYEVGSPVLSLDCNKLGIMSVGCLDRVARLYDTNAPFNLLGKTKNDSMPITACSFYKTKYLFTAGTDNLKAWNVEEDIILTDNIETNSKGIMHMVVGEKIQQIAYNSGTLSSYECFLSEVNFDGPYSYINPNIPTNNSISSDSPVLRDLKSRGKNNERNFNLSTLKKGHNSTPGVSAHLTNEKSKKIIEKKGETIAREIAGIHGNIHDVLNNIKRVSDTVSNRKQEVSQLKSMMEDEHSKFLKVMGNRAKSIQHVLNLWAKGNIKSIIHEFKKIDIHASSDILTQILKPSNVQISSEFGLAIAEKAKQMIKSKHLTTVRNGLEFMLQIVSLFKDQMIKLKTFGCDKGVDLARQERIRRLDLLIEQYIEVYQCHRLKKLMEKHDDTSNLAEKLTMELTIIFKKVFGNQYEF